MDPGIPHFIGVDTANSKLHIGPESSIPEGYRVSDCQGTHTSSLPGEDRYWIEPGDRTEGRHANEVTLSFRQYLESLTPDQRAGVLEETVCWCYDCGEEPEECTC